MIHIFPSGNWPNNAGPGGQYRGQPNYPPQANPQQNWQAGGQRPPVPGPGGNQWDQNRYPPNQQGPYQQHPQVGY